MFPPSKSRYARIQTLKNVSNREATPIPKILYGDNLCLPLTASMEMPTIAATSPALDSMRHMARRKTS